jgi:hypothetical protein
MPSWGWPRNGSSGGALAILLALAACGDDEAPLDPNGCAGTVERVELASLGRQPLPRIGAVLRINVSAVDDCDRPVTITESGWSTSDASVATARAALAQIGNDGEPFEVPDEGLVRAVGFGSATVQVEVEGVTADLPVEVVRPATRAEGLEVLGADSLARPVTDLWVHGDYAYSGTSQISSTSGSLIVWRLDGEGIPALVDSVALPGPHTNDVKVSPGGDYLVVSQEGAAATNGIVVLDLANPAAPTILAHFTEGLERGVHNVWLENVGGSDYAFVVEDGGGAESGLHVLDLSDPAAPASVTTWRGGSSQIHDVYVRDGLAFVSHWDDGLFILDVGHGMAGGSPASPATVSSLVMAGGNTHNAWYWPEGALVFVGEERYAQPADTTDVGQLHVVDVSDLSDPREIATYRIPGETPHNFWLDEDNKILYAGWYARGVRALDVSGILSGDLGDAGREIGFLEPSGSRGLGSIWAPQLHRGVLYLSDIHHGLWAVKPLR